MSELLWSLRQRWPNQNITAVDHVALDARGMIVHFSGAACIVLFATVRALLEQLDEGSK